MVHSVVVCSLPEAVCCEADEGEDEKEGELALAVDPLLSFEGPVHPANSAASATVTPMPSAVARVFFMS